MFYDILLKYIKDLNIWTVWCELVSVINNFHSCSILFMNNNFILSFSIIWHGKNVGYFLKKFVMINMVWKTLKRALDVHICINVYRYVYISLVWVLPIVTYLKWWLTHNLWGEVTAKGEGESGPECGALIGLILDFIISWNCLLKFKEIAGIGKCAKTKIFFIICFK